MSRLLSLDRLKTLIVKLAAELEHILSNLRARWLTDPEASTLRGG